VHAKRGKIVRAEPVSALYEQGTVKHAGVFSELEDQLCIYAGGGDSPDRLDALARVLINELDRCVLIDVRDALIATKFRIAAKCRDVPIAVLATLRAMRIPFGSILISQRTSPSDGATEYLAFLGWRQFVTSSSKITPSNLQ
jgi:hypothetical protein